MKRILVVSMSLFFMAVVMGQDSDFEDDKSRGMWLGGEVGFGTMAQGGSDFTLGPSFGLMLGDRLGAGITAVLSTGNNTTSWSLDPYARYYVPVIDNFFFYGDGFVSIGGSSTDGNGEAYFGLGARIGAQYWFTPSWSMAASSNVFTYYSDASNHAGVGLGLNMNALSFSMFWHF